MEDADKNLALTLKRAQQQTLRQTTVPLALRKKQITEEMDYFKNQLMGAIEQKDKKNIFQFTKKIIELRAGLTLILVEKHIELKGRPNNKDLEEYIKKYIVDSAKLTLLAEKYNVSST